MSKLKDRLKSGEDAQGSDINKQIEALEAERAALPRDSAGKNKVRKLTLKLRELYGKRRSDPRAMEAKKRANKLRLQEVLRATGRDPEDEFTVGQHSVPTTGTN